MDAAVESLFPYLRLEQTGEERIAGLLRYHHDINIAQVRQSTDIFGEVGFSVDD